MDGRSRYTFHKGNGEANAETFRALLPIFQACAGEYYYGAPENNPAVTAIAAADAGGAFVNIKDAADFTETPPVLRAEITGESYHDPFRATMTLDRRKSPGAIAFEWETVLDNEFRAVPPALQDYARAQGDGSYFRMDFIAPG